MKKRLFIASIGICITLMGGGKIAAPIFGVAQAWAEDDSDHGSDHESSHDSNDDDSESSSDSKQSDSRDDSSSGDTSHPEDSISETHNEQNKYGAVRDAVNQSKILSLSKVKEIVVQRFGTNIVDVKIEQDRNRWTYEFKIISGSGRLIGVYLNAKTGRVIKIEND